MFNQKNSIRSYGEFTSLLNEGLVFKGTQITGCGHMHISCVVECDVEIEGDVYVGFTGVIKGNVSCTNLTVEGVVTGDSVCATQTISIIKGGNINSDITCAGLQVADNSVLNGRCNMANPASGLRYENAADRLGPAKGSEQKPRGSARKEAAEGL